VEAPNAGPEAPVEQPSEFDLVLAAELGDVAETAPETGAEEPARRRRARGGRRRRPMAGEADAPAEAGEVVIEPVYADIADIFEAAERAEAEAALRINTAAPVFAEIPAEPAPEPEPQPEFAEIQPDPTPEAEPAPQPEPELVAFPVVKPIVVGADATVQEKKRGWWRR
jgi:hypothetical protein